MAAPARPACTSFRPESILMTQPASHGSGGATSLSLLERVRGNQAGAWERLVDLYAPLVYHWCRRAGLSADDAADVFQEVFRAVTAHIAEFRRDRAGDTF